VTEAIRFYMLLLSVGFRSLFHWYRWQKDDIHSRYHHHQQQQQQITYKPSTAGWRL